MEAMTVYVCPICSMAFTTVPVSHTPPPTRALCMGIPVAGTWIPEEAWPVVVDGIGAVFRLPKHGRYEIVAEATVDPAQPDEDRQTVVKPKDGDDRYWDDEQEKLRR